MTSAGPIDFADLTQSAFLLGVPAATWQTMLVSAYEKLDATANMAQIIESLLGALLDLFAAYPGDQSLLAYLRAAVQANFLPLSYAVSFFIRSAPQIPDAATFHLVFKTLVDLQFASGAPPYGSIVAYGDTVSVILNTVHACLPLLQTWETLTMPTPFHAQGSPVSQLVVLLLSCVQDLSTVTNVDAGVYYTDVSHVLHTTHVDETLRQSLENFLMSCSLLLGDNAKAAREVEMMQAVQLSLIKASGTGAAAGLDIITCGTLLRNLFDERAHNLSFGHTDAVVAVVRAVFHYTAMPLQAFYTQLILAAFDIVSQYAQQSTLKLKYQLWCSLVISRLPALLRHFEVVVMSEMATDMAPGAAMQAALRDVYGRTELIRRLDPATTAADEARIPLGASFLRSLIVQEFIDHQFAMSLEPSTPAEQLSPVMVEAQDSGMDLESYIESRVSMDGPIDDGISLLNRVVADYQVHGPVSEVLHKRFISLASTQDVEPLSHMCKVLSRHDITIDLLSLHMPLDELLGHGLHFVHNFTCEGVGDPQTAVSQFGVVVQFMQLTIIRLQLASFSSTLAGNTLRADFLLSNHRTYVTSELSPEELAAFHSWHKALFGRDSEGIDDHILRSTNPLTLLRIAPTLLSEAVAQAVVKILDPESLRNGVQFFIGPLLNWTLVGVIKSFVAEIDRVGYCATMHIDVLKLFSTAASNMPVVFRICAPHILRMVPEPQAQNLVMKQTDFRDMKRVAVASLSSGQGEAPSAQSSPQDHASFPSLAVRRALETARSGGAPGINIRRCLTVASPLAFLEILWAEFQASSADVAHDLDVFRRIAAHVLLSTATHSHPGCPPLLPIFLHTFLPRKIAWVETMFGEQQTRSVELLAAIVSSSMTAAFHLERSLNSSNTTSPAVKTAALRLKTTNLAARLSQTLQLDTGHVAAMIRQRLAAVQSFAAMYPEFAS